MSWLDAAPEIGAALLVLLAPGTVVLLAAGVPWRHALVYSPAPSVGLVGLTAIVARFAGVRFGLPVVAVATVACCAVLLGGRLLVDASMRRAVRGDRPGDDGLPDPARQRRTSASFALLSAVGLSAVVIGARIIAAIGTPDRVSQTFDAVYHLNTTRYIVESGDASSLDLLGWGTGTGGFYPAAWHDLAALVAVHGDVVRATDALCLVVGAVVWPMSILVLVARVAGLRWSVLLGTAALISGLGVFPAHLLDYGVLYPFLLGIALIPSLVAVVHRATGPADQRGALRGLALWMTGGLGFVGLALAHPGVLAALVVVVAPLVIRGLARVGRERWRIGRHLSTVVLAVGLLVVLALAAKVLAGSTTLAQMRHTNWPAFQSPSQAAGSWLLMTPSLFPVPWLTAALALLGIVVAVCTPGLRWLVVAHAFLAVPYVFAAGVDSPLSQLITGFWYNDPQRLGALVAVTGVPLAAVAIGWLTSRAWRHRAVVTGRFRRVPARRLGASAVVVATAVLLVLSVSDASSRGSWTAVANRYRVPAHAATGTLLSANEVRLLERLPKDIPAGTAVAANPWDGSGLAYAISGVPVLVPQLGAVPEGTARVVARGLKDAGSDPRVCDALRTLHIGYALTFGPPLWVDARGQAYPGLDGLAESSSVRLVDHQGNARLYQVTACGPLSAPAPGR